MYRADKARKIGSPALSSMAWRARLCLYHGAPRSWGTSWPRDVQTQWSHLRRSTWEATPERALHLTKRGSPPPPWVAKHRSPARSRHKSTGLSSRHGASPTQYRTHVPLQGRLGAMPLVKRRSESGKVFFFALKKAQ